MRHLPPPGLQAERRREGASPDPRGILESNTRTGPPTTATPGPPQPQPHRPPPPTTAPDCGRLMVLHTQLDPTRGLRSPTAGMWRPRGLGRRDRDTHVPRLPPRWLPVLPLPPGDPAPLPHGPSGCSRPAPPHPRGPAPCDPWGPRLSPPPGTSRLRPRLRGRRDPPSLRSRRTRARRVAARRTHARCGPGPGPARRRGLPLARDLSRGPPAPSTHRPPTAPPSPHRLQHPAEHLAQAGAGREPNPGNHGPSPKRPARLSGTALDTTASRRLRGRGRQGREEETQGQRPARARGLRRHSGPGGPASWGRGRHLRSLPWLKPVDRRRGLRFR